MAAPQYDPSMQPPPQPYFNQPPQQPQYAGQPQLQQQTSNNNIVVVQQQATPAVVHVQNKEKPSHLLHCIITFFCWPWIFVWLLMCCIYGC